MPFVKQQSGAEGGIDNSAVRGLNAVANVLYLRWRFTRAVAQALRNLLRAKSAHALGDKITRQRYTLPYSYIVYALESYNGVRGRMQKPYPLTMSAGRAV